MDDNGFVIFASNEDGFNTYNYDLMLLKIDSNGIEEWHKNYPNTNVEQALAFQKTTNGGFITLGIEYSSINFTRKHIVMKLDSLGNIEWEKNMEIKFQIIQLVV